MGETTSAPIIVGFDGSEASTDALRQAREMADALDRPVVVLVAWRYSSLSGVGGLMNLWGAFGDAERAALDAVRAVYGESVPDRVAVELVDGAPADELIRASDRASMLVVGSRGLGGLGQLLLGSVSAPVAERARCPVLVVH